MALIGRDDPAHQLMAHNVLSREVTHTDTFDPVQQADGLGKA
jgi:hypothetical protein